MSIDSGFSVSRRRLIAGSVAAGLAAAFPTALFAQQARGGVTRIVVPFAPGGGNDVFARQLAHGLSEKFGRDVIVENKPGAGGNLGTEQVVRSRPDSNTFLLGHTGTVSINRALYPNLKFDPATDLEPVAMFASSALLLVVPADSEIKSVADLVQAARKRGQDMNYASSGSGSGGHLTGELFLHELGARAVHVPYKGTAPALADVAGGQVDFCFSVIPAALSLVNAGKLRALAVTSRERLAMMPDVPTVAESGVEPLSRFESTLTYGVLAPRGVAPEEIATLSGQILQTASTPEFQSKLGVDGAVPLLGDAAAYARRIEEENRKWAEVVKVSGAAV